MYSTLAGVHKFVQDHHSVDVQHTGWSFYKFVQDHLMLTEVVQDYTLYSTLAGV